MTQNTQNPVQGSEYKYIDPEKNYSREEIQKMDFATVMEYCQLLDKRLYLVNMEVIKRDEQLTALRKNQLIGAFSINYPESIHVDEPPVDVIPPELEPDEPKQPRTA